MRARHGVISLVTMAASSVGLTQEVMCDPCVDYPEWRSPIPEPGPSPGMGERASVDGRFNLGFRIANLRGLNTASGQHTLTLVDRRQTIEDPVEDSSEGVVAEGEAEAGKSDEEGADNVESRNEKLDPGAEAIESLDQ